MLIFCPGLSVVAPLAKRLPVALVPEQLSVAPVRYDMVHNLGLGKPAFALALLAKRIGFQVSLAYLLPVMIITTVVCARSVLGMKPRMELAKRFCR